MAAASEFQKAIERFLQKNPGWRRAITPPAPGGLPGATSTGRPASGTSTSGGGGGGAFHEKDAAAREYYAARPLVSSDGVFTIMVKPIKSILLEDDSRATFKDPPP